MEVGVIFQFIDLNNINIYSLKIFCTPNVSVVHSSCPTFWDRSDSSCYYISSNSLVNGNKLSWHEALSKCEYYDGYLTVINNAAENVSI